MISTPIKNDQISLTLPLFLARIKIVIRVAVYLKQESPEVSIIKKTMPTDSNPTRIPVQNKLIAMQT